MSKLTDQQRKDLMELMGQPDETIDLSDIPEIRTLPSDAVRGKFYHPGIEPCVPVFLDPDIQSFLVEKAAVKGINLEKLVNDLLKRDIEAYRALL